MFEIQITTTNGEVSFFSNNIEGVEETMEEIEKSILSKSSLVHYTEKESTRVIDRIINPIYIVRVELVDYDNLKRVR